MWHAVTQRGFKIVYTSKGGISHYLWWEKSIDWVWIFLYLMHVFLIHPPPIRMKSNRKNARNKDYPRVVHLLSSMCEICSSLHRGIGIVHILTATCFSFKFHCTSHNETRTCLMLVLIAMHLQENFLILLLLFYFFANTTILFANFKNY